MNMKTLVIMVLMGISLATFAQENSPPGIPSETFNSLAGMQGNGKAEQCRAMLHLFKSQQAAKPAKSPVIIECENLERLSGGQLSTGDPKASSAKSVDGAITCKMPASYTVDFLSCEKAVAYYNSVLNTEVAMDLQQKIRTDLKAKRIQEEATKEAAQGNLQEGALNAGIANHKHMKQMNTEKMAAYGMAVAALVRAYQLIPGEKQAIQRCKADAPAENVGACDINVKGVNKPAILANQEAKAAIGLAIAKFTAKALAAGIAMGQNIHAAKKIEEVKNQYDDGGEDAMMERCTFNPTDPACAKPGNRVAGQSFAGGEFGLGAGGNNAFDMTSDSGNFVEEGAATDLSNDSVSGINSPFAEEAKNARKIVDPAAAAQMQASGGASGGGAGGGAGGGGGGGASLGSDLSGADKDGDKEASIKTNKVSGVYGSAGGSGYKGIGKGKDDANPFASLFDAKSSGGIEEDRSIASGDIDGAASGLFQKISKRYSQIQADKRIETKNLE